MSDRIYEGLASAMTLLREREMHWPADMIAEAMHELREVWKKRDQQHEDFESLADWMGEQDWTVNVQDYTDEYETYVREQPVELLAERIIESDWLVEHDRQVAERAWDEGYEAAAEFHEGREKGHWENDFPTKGMRTWRPDPAPTSPYRAAKGEQQ